MANKIILGSVQFGLNYGINNRYGKPNEIEVSKMLDLAMEEGIQHIDTAEAYGNAHEVIGKYHEKSGKIFKIISKYSASRKDLPATLSERIHQNLRTLHVDSLYGYMFHSYSDFENFYPQFKAEIDDLKVKGLIKKFGVSIYTNHEFEKVLNYTGIDLIQVPFNLLDNSSQRGILLERAKAAGIEIHTRSVFLQGLFFKKTSDLNGKLSTLIEPLKEIQHIASRHNLSLQSLALNYCINQQNIDFVLIGVDNAEQLAQNLNSLTQSVNEEATKQIDALHLEDTTLLNPANWNL